MLLKIWFKLTVNNMSFKTLFLILGRINTVQSDYVVDR